MRQAGVLAAAALYALAHHRERIAEDHAAARQIAAALRAVPGAIVARRRHQPGQRRHARHPRARGWSKPRGGAACSSARWARTAPARSPTSTSPREDAPVAARALAEALAEVLASATRRAS